MARASRRVSLPSEVGGQCVFCGIAAGRQPASVVADEQDVLAFCDLQPVHPGHLLVIPRVHATGLAELPDATGRAMFSLAQRLAMALRACGLPCEGVNLFLADGAAAGQEIDHVHLHVVPRTVGDGAVRISAAWSLHDRARLDDTAARVRGVLSGSS
ncbi:HIT family protein [Pseudonocardia sp.]|uniref:HIT family protein n=1 Tax=Pseudonocardia sp. TaxID=60912 RepID=UPI002F4161DC